MIGIRRVRRADQFGGGRRADHLLLFACHAGPHGGPYRSPVASRLCWAILVCLLPGDVLGQPPAERFRLWEPESVPTAAETPLLEGVRFVTVHDWRKSADGFNWLHGAAIARYEGTLFTSWGHNPGKENTITEVTRGRRSRDGGLTWSATETIGPGGPLANSHGVFLVHGGRLWALLARFGQGEGRFKGLAMEAFMLDPQSDRWQSRGVVAQGFWPLREPVRMPDGNWFISGCDENWRAAVAISRGDDVTAWDTIRIPVGGRLHTEAAAWIEGRDVTLVMRNQTRSSSQEPFVAAISPSHDCGRTWSPSVESNLPMTTSKPYAGHLSTGQRYLVCTTVADHRSKRYPLTIAVGRPGEKLLCRMWRIRDGRLPGTDDPRDRALAYPHAVELDGHLYVIYSVDKRDCELAVIPVAALAVK